MAFRFFRKRQKLVIIIMVALMVSFLIGIQGFNMFCRRRGGGVMGESSLGEIKGEQRVRASYDLEMLRQFLRFGQARSLRSIRPTEVEFVQLLGNGRNADLAFVLLQQEARDAGLEVGDEELEAFLAQLLSPADRESLKSTLRASTSASLQDFQGALARWLLVHKAYAQTRVAAPPSEAEARDLFRQLNEKINLRVAKVTAEKFGTEVTDEEAAQEVPKQFERFRDKFAGTYPDAQSPGFGYKQPDRAQINYMLIRTDVIKRVARPKDEIIYNYYDDHAEELTREEFLGAGKVAQAFAEALVAGRGAEARKLVSPSAPAAKQIKDPRKITSWAGEVRIEKGFADQIRGAALAMTNSVKGPGGTGPLAVRLATENRRWRVTEFNVLDQEEAEKHEAEFLAENTDAKPLRRKTVPMTVTEALPRIIEHFSEETVTRLVTRLSGRITALLKEADTSTPAAGKDAYEWAYGQMVQESPATEALGRRLEPRKVRAIRNVRLDEAVRRLGRLGRLGAICYPWGTHGKTTIDPDIRVTLEAPDGAEITLGEALAQIDRQVFAASPEATTQPATRPATRPAGKPAKAATRPASRPAPRLKWAACRGLQIEGRQILFPAGGAEGLNLMPIQAGKTKMLTRSELENHDVLGWASSVPGGLGGEQLADSAFSAAAFHPGGEVPARVEVGGDGARMYVGGSQPGVLLWRLAKAEPAFVPEKMDDVPGLRAKVEKDARTSLAYRRAVKAAGELKEAAEGLSLKAEAKARGIETYETGLFAAKTHVPMLWLAPMMGVFRPEMLLQPPHQFYPSRIEGVDLPAEGMSPEVRNEIQDSLVTAAFDLLENGDEAHEPGPLAVVPLPANKVALVMQRIGYRPPLESEYEQPDAPHRGRNAMIKTLMEMRQWKMRSAWFDFDKIAKRLDYKPRNP